MTGVELALLAICIDARLVPTDVAVKLSVIEQLLSGGTGERVQSSRSMAKSWADAPFKETSRTISGPDPLFVIVTVCGSPLARTSCLPKSIWSGSGLILGPRDGGPATKSQTSGTRTARNTRVRRAGFSTLL